MEKNKEEKAVAAVAEQEVEKKDEEVSVMVRKSATSCLYANAI